jgi:CelD/BcsL family acetyltransferase involved in cellulose biosynthesis
MISEVSSAGSNHLVAHAPTDLLLRLPDERPPEGQTVAPAMMPDGAAMPLRVTRLTVADYAGMGEAFADLARRASRPNPLMSPAAVKAVAQVLREADIVVLVATCAQPAGQSQREQLQGVWVLRRRRTLWSLGAEVLETPARPAYDNISDPVLDAALPGQVMAAFASHLRACPDLPKVIRATNWPRDLDATLPADVQISREESWQRAMLMPEGKPDAEAYLRAAMGRNYRIRSKRLADLDAQGTVSLVSLRGDAAVSGLEAYIALEARGWKGRAGTALANEPDGQRYFRAIIASLAASDQIAVDQIRLDDKPIAIGLAIEADGHSMLWKTTFDEDFARFGPGMLLNMVVTRRLFATGRASLDSGMTEFSSPDLMPWSERRAMARATLDLGAGLAGHAERLGAGFRHRLRRLVRRLRRS